MHGDGFDQISCLTAVNLEGKVLWQSGQPDPRNGLLTNDLPFQIHDIDGDGHNEVVVIKDFQLQVWEGATGKLTQSIWMPKMPADGKPRPYEFENGDAIAFLNLSGDARRRKFWLKTAITISGSSIMNSNHCGRDRAKPDTFLIPSIRTATAATKF